MWSIDWNATATASHFKMSRRWVVAMLVSLQNTNSFVYYLIKHAIAITMFARNDPPNIPDWPQKWKPSKVKPFNPMVYQQLATTRLIMSSVFIFAIISNKIKISENGKSAQTKMWTNKSGLFIPKSAKALFFYITSTTTSLWPLSSHHLPCKQR